jgi:hypothetical protein
MTVSVGMSDLEVNVNPMAKGMMNWLSKLRGLIGETLAWCSQIGWAVGYPK